MSSFHHILSCTGTGRTNQDQTFRTSFFDKVMNDPIIHCLAYSKKKQNQKQEKE